MDKIKGISFTIDNKELYLLDEMPDYYTLIKLSSFKGQTKSNIHYPLKYPPANYNSWQQYGRVVTLISRKFTTAQFEEVVSTGSYVYTLQEFAQYFNDFVELPKPYYPQSKKDYMRHLTFYAQRLHFYGVLNIGYINAMAIKFNVFLGTPYSYKDVLKKSWGVFLLDRCNWKIKKGKASNKESSFVRKQKQIDKINIIASHLEQFTNSKGKVNVTSLANHLSISNRTLYRLLPKAKAIECMDIDHITKPNGKNTNTRGLYDDKTSTILQSQMAKKDIL